VIRSAAVSTGCDDDDDDTPVKEFRVADVA
jgi:hypothetical protein